ncbi:group II intron reverse transcriptase/maturase [Frankia sp. CcI49]|uniref:group II intron reverse transcriptase/maturase n=1 Tax=Frankia sp. CcI49 TaxID=1745382 RepID=UPI001F51D3D9|nr:group II intron reverse transcriptase/maturase [Frankia sp. CcI49]
MKEPKSKDKPFAIPKQAVVEAFRKVKANQGGPGVDGRTIEDFESDLRNRLYVTWNRMSSGSYFPPPVKLVEVPKPHGRGVRRLGVPTVADRVAQTVVAAELEKVVESKFHPNSYGYRPGRSPLDAVAACRERCFTHPWVFEIDIQGFFDNVPHDLIVKAVEANTDRKWVVLYVKRWLVAPVQHPDGTLERRDRGTPQGSAISPLLANLFLHYAFDVWMAREFPSLAFERFCDDIVVHCFSEKQASYVGRRIAVRLGECGLQLHPDKSRIVYCQQDGREDSHEHTSFTFLGYTFQRRSARGADGGIFSGFLPAVSKDAMIKMNRAVHSWRLPRWTTLSLNELAAWVNQTVRGWLNYYGRFYPTALRPLLRRINAYLLRWVRKKYKRLRSFNRALAWWNGVVKRDPGLFAHWEWDTVCWMT